MRSTLLVALAFVFLQTCSSKAVKQEDDYWDSSTATAPSGATDQQWPTTGALWTTANGGWTTAGNPDTSASPGSQHQEKVCSNNTYNVWLDLVILFDSTKSAGSDGFNNLIGFALDFFQYEVQIGLDDNRTRLALINVGDNATVIADLTTITRPSDLRGALQNLKYQNANNYNLVDGLSKAEVLFQGPGARPFARKAAIVFSTQPKTCTGKAEELAADDDPCKVVARFRANNWAIISVAVKLAGEDAYPILSLGYPCYETHDDDNLVNDLRRYLPDINCFCPKDYTQFTPAGGCTKTGTCVLLSGDVHTGFDGASLACQQQGTTLSTVYSQDKEIFLANIARSAGTFLNSYIPFWSGLRRDGGAGAPWYWDNKENLNDGDYTNWASGEPAAVRYGDCGIIASAGGFSTNWQSKSCRLSDNAFAYFCQAYACDADILCTGSV